MKIAVISDIHGNMQALETVVQDIEKNACDQVFCLGDLAMAGPQPRAVIDFIKSRPDWTIIQGNTDKLIADLSPELFNEVKERFPIMAKALADDVIFIEEDKKDFLRQLPPKKELTVEGVNILLVHGSPRRNNEDILPQMPLEKIAEIIKETSADVILCGHTHIPAGYQTRSKQTVINVGSVGRPMSEDLKACYAILDFDNGGFSVEHRFLDYDRELAAGILKMRDFEGANQLAEMLTKPMPRHI